MFKISIPKPCFEGWENMTPDGLGRHCNACAKTVVDFSVMSDEAVQQYFISNYGNSICGHFRNTQLQRIVIELPKNIFHIQLPLWKKFLVAFLICFGGSFLAIDTTMAGNSFYQGDTIYQQTVNTKSNTKKQPRPKKKKLRIKDYTFISITTGNIIPVDILSEGRTDGFCIIQKERDYAFPFRDLSSLADSNKNSNPDSGTTVKNNPNAPHKKENREPKLPEPTTAFILPAALALKNPFSKKKKAKQ